MSTEDFLGMLEEIQNKDDQKPHHRLDVWKRSIQFVRKIYQLTEKFPDQEKFGLVQQMRRAATSVSSNIAEGAARRSDRDFGNFLGIAQGSNSELETQLFISLELDYLQRETAEELLEELNQISRMISGLRKSLIDRST